VKKIIAAIGAGIGIAIIVGVIILQQTIPVQTELQEVVIPQSESKIKVIASFYPLYEFSKNLGGDRAQVSVFTPIGVEPHDWEPSTGDLIALQDADVFVYNGGGMEPFLDKLLDSGEYSDILFVDSTQNLGLITHENEHDHPYDPHVWLDPISAKDQVMMIKDALIKVDGQNAQYYEDNANAYSAKLDELDSKIKSELASCAKDTIVPFHNAFSYFGARYGIHVHALSGIAPESEVTASDLKETIDFIRENQIKIVFAEELVDPKLAQILADEAGAQILLLSPLEGITPEEQENGISYLDKMEENLKNIKTALECT
jgi:zinc transport system substrate-binding protein